MAEIDAGRESWELAVSDAGWREEQGRRATVLAGDLTSVGVDGVALSYVDNAGVTRVKTVPVAGLAHAAASVSYTHLRAHET